jgi:hypothetical protein
MRGGTGFSNRSTCPTPMLPDVCDAAADLAHMKPANFCGLTF